MTLKLVSWNVNGIRAAYRKTFKDFLKSHKPDLLYLQETKAHPNQLEDEQKSPLSYQSLFSSAEKKGYSGVSCFYKKSIEPKKALYGLGKNSSILKVGI